MNTNPTQVKRVLNYIELNGSITQLEAIRDIGVMRLASRINEIKKLGLPITSEFIKVRNRFGETVTIKKYFMIEKGEEDDGDDKKI